MSEVMAVMIASRVFNWRRPKSVFSFHIEPGDGPKSFPHDFVEAAVAAGAATRVKPGRRQRRKAN